jgi:heme A synthase
LELAQPAGSRILDMRTESSPGLHLYAILVALCALIAIALGAIVTSLLRPIAGPIAARPAAAASFESWHHMAGGVTVVLMLGLAIGLSTQLGWIGLGAAILDGVLGARAITSALPQISGILHALLGQIVFGMVVAIAVMTSASWKRGPEPIEDTWRPSLRSLALAVPAIVLLQTTLGAAYRYRALSVIWHILNAMIVLLLILIVSVFLIRQFPQHAGLRPAAITLAVITSIQVALGFTTFLMLILYPESSPAVVITSVLHVFTGALTFGAGVALALQIRFNVQGQK